MRSAGRRSPCPAGLPRTASRRRSNWWEDPAPTRSFWRPAAAWRPSFEGQPNEGGCRQRHRTMLRASLLAAVCLGLLTLAPAAEAAKPVRGAAPKNLHGFLLRADEPADNSFTRTPSFAWNPIPGAIRYQFQLATSSSFRESGLVYSTSGTSPVFAPTLMLPWITGNPHALFARVRGITATATTPWSNPFGFDMAPG